MSAGSVAIAFTPWAADLLGVGGLVGRVLITGFSFVIVAVLWSQLFVNLGIVWSVAGKGEALYR